MWPMKLLFAAIPTLILSVPTFAQEAAKPADSKQNLPPAVSASSPTICGPGTFEVSLGSQSLGRETFEIKCASENGFSATGNTKLTVPGAFVDLNTTLDVDRTGLLAKFSAKGNTGGQAIDQVITVNKQTASILTSGVSKEIPFNGDVILVGNVSYLYQFIVARYDVAQGGNQKISLLGDGQVSLEQTARDEVQPVGLAAVPPTPFDRYSLNLGPVTIYIWTDNKGRVALISVPAQNFSATREEYLAFAQPLRAALIASVKGLVRDYGAPANAYFTAEEVKVSAKSLTLACTLLVPKNAKRRLPVVVTSTGSGQQTRDEPIPIPGLEDYKLFRQVGESLASHSIAVLRCDDRGVGDSTGLDTLASATTFDFADDVRAQVASLRTRSDIDPDRIAIIGHSEGGVIAPMVAASDKRLAAIVLMAGTGKRGDEVLRFQLNYPVDNDSKLSKEERDKKHQETEEFLRAIATNGDMSKYPAILRGLSSL